MPPVGWTFFYMFVVLKIPVAFALWLVWYATREPAPQEPERSDGEGGSRHERHPRGRPPRPPRRGPHADPQPRPPARVRVEARSDQRVRG